MLQRRQSTIYFDLMALQVKMGYVFAFSDPVLHGFIVLPRHGPYKRMSSSPFVCQLRYPGKFFKGGTGVLKWCDAIVNTFCFCRTMAVCRLSFVSIAGGLLCIFLYCLTKVHRSFLQKHQWPHLFYFPPTILPPSRSVLVIPANSMAFLLLNKGVATGMK